MLIHFKVRKYYSRNKEKRKIIKQFLQLGQSALTFANIICNIQLQLVKQKKKDSNKGIKANVYLFCDNYKELRM